MPALRSNSLVGKAGFEPATPCSQSRCASQAAPLPVTLRLAATASALGRLRKTLGSPANRLEMAVVEIADFSAVVEQHPVALPVEAVGE